MNILAFTNTTHRFAHPGLTLCALAGILVAGIGAGCDSTQPGGGPATPLFSQAAPAGGEKWAILCLQATTPAGAEELNRLAEMLKRVNGLQPAKVRVIATATGASLYYGEYIKTASPQTGLLVFPPEYQRDLDLIRRLTVAGDAPFKYAAPELLEKKVAAAGQWDVSRNPAAYTLLIAVFYNDATLSQREQAAEDYVKLLREAGHSGWYRHEQLRSYVFVGEFTGKDIVTLSDGSKQYGPRVEKFIRANEQEFRNVTENGKIVKRRDETGKLVAPQSYLVPVPKETPRGAVALPMRSDCIRSQEATEETEKCGEDVSKRLSIPPRKTKTSSVPSVTSCDPNLRLSAFHIVASPPSHFLTLPP